MWHPKRQTSSISPWSSVPSMVSPLTKWNAFWTVATSRYAAQSLPQKLERRGSKTLGAVNSARSNAALATPSPIFYRPTSAKRNMGPSKPQPPLKSQRFVG
jgi:hypothetical protein